MESTSPSGTPVARAVAPPLTFRWIAAEALATYREDALRIGGLAIAVFVPLGFLEALVEYVLHESESDGSGTFRLALVSLILASTGASIWGLTFFAGALDCIVEAHRRGHAGAPIRDALRTLPYGRLIAAGVIVYLVVSVGLVLFVVPGLVATTLLAIVGPLVNIERATVRRAIVDSVRLTRAHARLAGAAITLPLIVEHAISDWVVARFWQEDLLAGFAANAGFALVVGAIVGLLEVTLAHELITRDRARRGR